MRYGYAALGGCAGSTEHLHLGLPFFEDPSLLTWLLAAGLILGCIATIQSSASRGIVCPSCCMSPTFFCSCFACCPTPPIQQTLARIRLLPPLSGLCSGFRELLAVVDSVLDLRLPQLAVECFLCARHKRRRGPESRAIAAFRTGRFAFVVPTLLSVIVTCALWSGVVVYGSDKLKAFDEVTMEVADNGPSSSNTCQSSSPK